MSFPKTVRYSTLARLVFPFVLMSLLVVVITLVMLDLVFTLSQGLNGLAGHQYYDPHEQQQQQLNQKRTKTLILEKSILDANNDQHEDQIDDQEDINLPTKANQLTVDREFFNYLTANLRDTPYPGVGNYTQYAVARLGLTPLVNVDTLIPEFGPVINDVLSFQYPIFVPNCFDPNFGNGNRTVFIAVISATDNFERRQIIRQTWRNHLNDVHEEGLMTTGGFAFVLGQTEDEKTQNQIEEEASTYGDIMQIDISDFYRNLPLKGIALLNWMHKYCAEIDFLVKVDDDVYVNVRNLAKFVQTHQLMPSSKSIFGVGKPRSGWPDRDDKWEMSFEEWPWSEYPPYILGAIVLISGHSILPLLAASQTTPIMPMEDVYFYGICAKKAGIEIHYSSTGPTRSLIGSINRAPTTCELGTLIAWRVDFHDFTKLREIMHLSHETVDNFYRNATQCISSFASNGDDSPPVDHQHTNKPAVLSNSITY